MHSPRQCKLALTGDVALELPATYFRDAGYDVMPQDGSLDAFRPDVVYDVTSAEKTLADEVEGFYDSRMEKLSGCRFSRDGLLAIVDEFAWFRESSPRKVLAVDADGTLWRGILSEDGADALVPCREFQKALRELKADGVVIVLLTKNDPPAQGAESPLNLDFVTVAKIGWGPKAGSLIEACRELNLPTDSVVFVDDNPHERAQMKAHLSEVAVAPWNGWPSGEGEPTEKAQRQLARRLREYFFSGMGKTDEDRLRAYDYATRRLSPPSSFVSTDDYLDDLGLWVRPALAAEGDLERLAQMAGKTNQFNATTIRRTKEDFAALIKNDACKVFTFRAGDRFGEQGLVCYIVADLNARRITDFVMSCRAMGRTLEDFALAYVDRALGYRPEIDFVPTAKNKPFAAFLASLPGGNATHYRELPDGPEGDRQ